MTKQEEIVWLDKAIAHLGPHTYLGGTLADQRESIIADIRNDIGPLRLAELRKAQTDASIAAHEAEKRLYSLNADLTRVQEAIKFSKNHLRVVAAKNAVTVSDEVRFEYQTAKWGKPARFAIAQIARDKETVTLEATALDAKGVLCLDAKNIVRFSLAGSGSLIDNQGTSTGSRVVQLYNGRARISILANGGPSTASVTSEGIAPAFVTVSA